jgi:glycosyltransferase involved in cell wall biosynthesis
MAQGISIIICCYNSAERIGETLQYLARQQAHATYGLELVLVDNNCTDNTVAKSHQVWAGLKNPFPLHVVTEQRAGLSFARECGVRSSSYEYLIFCDDDNWLTEDYVDRVFVFLSTHAEYAAIGGRIEARFEPGTQVPDWFSKEAKNFAVGKQALQSGDITSRGFLWGAGLAFRKDAYLKVTNASVPMFLEDRKGRALSSGGDGELGFRWVIVGYKLYYMDDLILYHFIPPFRLSEVYLNSLLQGHDACSAILKIYRIYHKNYLSRRVKVLIRMKWRVRYWLSRLKIAKLSEFGWIMIALLTSIKVSQYDVYAKSIVALRRKELINR